MEVVWALAFVVVVSWIAVGVATVLVAYCTPAVRQAVLEHSKRALRRAYEQRVHQACMRQTLTPRRLARMRRAKSDAYHLAAAALTLSSTGFFALPLLMQIVRRARANRG